MSGKEELQALRGQIDEIDNQLIPLIEQRFGIVEKVARVKQENNLAVLDSGREEEILNRLAERVPNALRGDVSLLMRTMMALSKSHQRRSHFEGEDLPLLPPPAAPAQNPTCAYQGIPGAWSEQVLSELFPDAKTHSCDYFEDVFKAVNNHEADYGIVPIENSQTGAIGETYDLLRKYGCFIVGRKTIEIRQCLLAPKEATIEEITHVFSHPEALSQCRRYLQKKPWELVPCRNTAAAAQQVAQSRDTHAAAIASLRAASCYGLAVLEEDIMDTSANRTAFIVIAAQPEYTAESQMVTATFSTAHRSGALCEILMPFMAHNINLARIESRPSTQGNYRFFADFEGNIEQDAMVSALRQAAAAAEYFEVLGCYGVR